MSDDGSRPVNYGATLGFLNLSVACSFLARPTIFRWVALMGFALQGFVPLTQTRRLVTARHTLLTFFLKTGLRLPR